MANKRFAVFDSDSHVVETPELWNKYLDPEFRTLGKSALWREDGKLGSYLKVNGKVFRDTMNSNIPRHAIWKPGMTWDKVGELDPRHSTRRDRGRIERGGAPARHGCDGHRSGAALSDLVRRGLPPGRGSRRRVRARARLQRLDRGFLQSRAGPAVRRVDGSAAEHRLCRRGASPHREDSVFSRGVHPADVSRRPLLHASDLRSAMGGAREPRDDRRGASRGRDVESGVDVARPFLRER